MKKKELMPAFFAALLLSACQNTPDNIKSNKHSANIDSSEVYVASDHIYDSFDAAYETDYTKFKLPDKTAVSICDPEGVYEIELSYVNGNIDTDWMSSKIDEFQDALGFSIAGKIEKTDDITVLEDNANKIKIERYSRPYFCWEASESGVNTTNIEADNVQLFYLNRPTIEPVESDLSNAADKAKTLADKISGVLGDELDNTISDGYVLKSENDVGYEIEIQKSYKGIGIQNVISTYSDESLFVKGDTLMSYSMQTYVDFDSSFDPQYYIGCDAFKIARSKKIDKMISFKGACDLLEENLADKIDIQFDDIVLMYEPRGTEVDMDELNEAENIICTPKWYFIIDDKQPTGLHAINYVTVDCVTGEIYVLIP